MTFYIPKAVYRSLASHQWQTLLGALGRQNEACLRFLECLSVQPAAISHRQAA